nr:hypothetical protein [Paenibacillus prosopidis]
MSYIHDSGVGCVALAVTCLHAGGARCNHANRSDGNIRRTIGTIKPNNLSVIVIGIDQYGKRTGVKVIRFKKKSPAVI